MLLGVERAGEGKEGRAHHAEQSVIERVLKRLKIVTDYSCLIRVTTIWVSERPREEPLTSLLVHRLEMTEAQITPRCVSSSLVNHLVSCAVEILSAGWPRNEARATAWSKKFLSSCLKRRRWCGVAHLYWLDSQSEVRDQGKGSTAMASRRYGSAICMMV